MKEPSEEVRKLRAKLILEEALETAHALGINVVYRNQNTGDLDNINVGSNLEFHNTRKFDLAEVIDGCADIKVVTTGTLIACGVPDEVAQQMVDQSNLKKFGPGGRRREDGKWLKPENWKAPNWQNYLTQLELAQKP